MKDILIDTLYDSLKLLPFLLITFFIMEYIEHKMTNKNKQMIQKAGRFGPFIGGILGAFPQCGFSVAATNLYATRIISLGTLIAIYLSTSDEMLPILISEKAAVNLILIIIFIKILVGILFGFIIDFIFRKNNKSNHQIKDFCEDEHCDCKHGIFKSTLKHTFHIFIFIIIISIILNIGFSYLGKDKIAKIFMKDSIFGSFLASLIGLVPNCGSSVVITELYLNHTISLGSMIAGLLTGSGVALIVLFKVNKNLKENLKILLTIYSIGVLIGFIIDLIGITL